MALSIYNFFFQLFKSELKEGNENGKGKIIIFFVKIFLFFFFFAINFNILVFFRSLEFLDLNII
jgi:hypothetical protein